MLLWPSKCRHHHHRHYLTTNTKAAVSSTGPKLLRYLGSFEPRLDKLTLAVAIRFTDCEKWRKEFKVDGIVNDFVYVEKPKVFEYYPQYYHKIDKDGRPVYIEQLGKIDLQAMLKITTEERMIQNLVLEYERLAEPRLPACSRKAGKLLETCCTIMDLKGVGVTSIPQVYGFLKKVSAISQNYYPERLVHFHSTNEPVWHANNATASANSTSSTPLGASREPLAW